MPTDSSVIDNPQENRFELAVEGQTAVLNYERTPKSLVLVHTEVPASLRGRLLVVVVLRGRCASLCPRCRSAAERSRPCVSARERSTWFHLPFSYWLH